jgi:hypothetical protein
MQTHRQRAYIINLFSYPKNAESRQENKAGKEILNFQVKEKGNYYNKKILNKHQILR